MFAVMTENDLTIYIICSAWGLGNVLASGFPEDRDRGTNWVLFCLGFCLIAFGLAVSCGFEIQNNVALSAFIIGFLIIANSIAWISEMVYVKEGASRY